MALKFELKKEKEGINMDNPYDGNGARIVEVLGELTNNK